MDNHYLFIAFLDKDSKTGKNLKKWVFKLAKLNSNIPYLKFVTINI